MSHVLKTSCSVRTLFQCPKVLILHAWCWYVVAECVCISKSSYTVYACAAASGGLHHIGVISDTFWLISMELVTLCDDGGVCAVSQKNATPPQYF